MARTAEDLVRAEVHYCISSLVSMLAQTANIGANLGGLGEALDQALELALPIDDWEEAATQAGWKASVHPNYFNIGEAGEPMQTVKADGWRGLCEDYDIEPYAREVFEHWIVSDWLADKLAEKGEKVDKDFAGMTVWARTTTGQGIASDSVIEQIAADLAKEI